MTRYVSMLSGGRGSWAATRRIVDQHGPDNVTLLFADVKGADGNPYTGEHVDTYRFLEDAAADLGAPLVRLRDGRDIWDVFHDTGWLGNSSLAHCSWELKTRICREWLDTNADPDDTIVIVGMDWTEGHRHAAVHRGYHHTIDGCANPRHCAGLFDDDGQRPGPGCRNLMWEKRWRVEMPMTAKPLYAKPQVDQWMRNRGLKPPAMYGMGFSHANCVSCVKGGQAHHARVLRMLPAHFAYAEAQEQRFRESRPERADYSILKDRSDADVHGDKARPLPLSEFRRRIEQADKGTLPLLVDQYDEGGCGCFTDA